MMIYMILSPNGRATSKPETEPGCRLFPKERFVQGDSEVNAMQPMQLLLRKPTSITYLTYSGGPFSLLESPIIYTAVQIYLKGTLLWPYQIQLLLSLPNRVVPKQPWLKLQIRPHSRGFLRIQSQIMLLKVTLNSSITFLLLRTMLQMPDLAILKHPFSNPLNAVFVNLLEGPCKF
jgi:hypothetical protein